MKLASPPNLTIQQLSDRVPGAKLCGNALHTIKRFVHPAEVESGEDLSLIMSPGALQLLAAEDSKHRCAMIAKELVDHEDTAAAITKLDAYFLVDRPRYALARITDLFSKRVQPDRQIHPSAVIEEGAKIGAECSIGAHCWIAAGAEIGDGTTLMANVSIAHGAKLGTDCLIYPGVFVGYAVQLGDRVIIHPNASIGGDGFAFDTPEPHHSEQARKAKSKIEAKAQSLERIESLGTVKVAEDVEIGAGTTIDRSTLGATTIGRGTKIDNLVQIGHGVTVGQDVLICAQVGIAGSCHIGDGAVLAGKVGIADHRRIGPHAVLMAKSGVTKDIPPGQVYYGMPARPVRDTLKSYSHINQLDDFRTQLAQLKSELAELKKDRPNE